MGKKGLSGRGSDYEQAFIEGIIYIHYLLLGIYKDRILKENTEMKEK